MQADWVQGEVARISLEVRNVSDVLADPGGLVFKSKSPTGVVATLTYGVDAALVKDAVGQYHVDLTLSAAGTWKYRWECTGTNAGANQGTMSVAAAFM